MEVSWRNRNLLLKIILILLWLSVQLGVYLKLGVQTSVDSFQYIEDANSIISGALPQDRSVWYLGYTSFLALVFFLGGTLKAIVILQILLSGLAAVSVYTIATKIFEDNAVAWLSVLLYVGWIKIHEWNTFIYTESFFTSFTIISFMLLLKSHKPWHFVLTLVVIVFTFFIRPAGFAFVAGVAVYLLNLFSEKTTRKTLISITILLTIGWLFLLNKMMVNYPLLDSYVKGEIIYPDINLGVEVPDALFTPSTDLPPLVRWILFLMGNPLYCSKLFLIKLLLFFGNVKPYFSWFHNIMIVVTLYPLYFFAVKGFRKLPMEKKEKYFILTYVLVQGFTVALTSENWDGRFLIPVLSFIFILSAGGINSTISNRFLQKFK